MTRKIFFAFFLILCITVCFAAVPGLAGKWTGNLIKDDGNNYPVNYELAVNDSLITGTAKSELGEFPIDSGRIDTGGFSFKVIVNGLDINHHGKFYGDSIGMDIDLNGARAHCTLTRSNN